MTHSCGKGRGRLSACRGPVIRSRGAMFDVGDVLSAVPRVPESCAL